MILWIYCCYWTLFIKNYVVADVTVQAKVADNYARERDNISIKYSITSTDKTVPTFKRISLGTQYDETDQNKKNEPINLAVIEFEQNIPTVRKNNVSSFNGRIDLKYVNYEVEFTLKNLRATDFKRVYTCTVYIGKFDQAHGTAKLEKAEPPKIQQSSIFPKASLKRGENHEYLCRASGVPSPDVTWYIKRDKKQPLSSGNGKAALRITEANTNDTENYLCVAKNIIAKDEKTLSLTVAYIEHDIGSSSFKRVFVEEGGTFDAECKIGGHPGKPNLKYIWKKPTGAVQSSDKRILIDNVRADDLGNYTCEAKNDAGTLSYVVELVKSKRVSTSPSTEGQTGQNGSNAAYSISSFFISFVSSSLLNVLIVLLIS